ncbi:MAG: M23 family metallopeptidase [Bacteroidetes bacterium]|nr:M23 family metallopeptidase [Bacteroidota bacterium]
MKERSSIILKLIVTHILPIIALTCFSFFSGLYPLIFLALAQTVLLIIFLAGYWEFFGNRFKLIFCLSAELILIFAFARHSGSLFHFESDTWCFALLAVEAYLIYELIKITLVRLLHEQGSMEIEFPLKNGTYLITDGGNSSLSRLMNYHFHSSVHKKKKTNTSMKFATDIVKFGTGISNFMPTNNEEYPIFNEELFSPLDGIVVKVVNDIDDNTPFSGNYPYNTGNHVVIRKDYLYLLLGHLRKDSILVKEGDILRRNDRIGSAGNSGMSERPHLHMQLMKSDDGNYWSGTGISIRFRNRNIYKNRAISLK